MPPTLSSAQMVADANQRIRTLSVEEALGLHGDNSTQFVDIRDIRERQRSGTIPNAFHAPRGMLEFWIDPQSPYFKPVFGEDKLFIFYCQSAWRSALAAETVQRMGLPQVAHIHGGFSAWQAAGGAVIAIDQ